MRTIWTERQLEILREKYYSLGGDLCKELPFTARQIISKASRLSLCISPERKTKTCTEKYHRTIWTKEQLQALREKYYLLGVSLSKELPFTARQIIRKANSLRLYTGTERKAKIYAETAKRASCRTIWTEQQLQILREKYYSLGGDGLSKELPFTARQIVKKASTLCLYIGPERRAEISAETAKRASHCRPERCKVNAGFFMPPKTKEAAYLLGFLWADGYLINHKNNNHFRITLEIIADDLDSIMPAIKKSGEWSTTFREAEYKHGVHRKSRKGIVCSNKQLYQFLEANGYTKKHEAANLILSQVPEDLKHYWVRGLFDGDGCIHASTKNNLYQVSVAAGYEQDWSFIEGILNELNIKYQIQRVVYRKGNKGSAIRFSGKSKCKSFANYIYGKKYDNMGLKRKWLKFKSIPDYKRPPRDDQLASML